MNIRADIAELLHAGHPQAYIVRELHVAPRTVQHTREALGLPAPRCGPPDTYTSEEDAYRSNSKAIDGGHQRWTGHTDTNGHPRLNFRQQRLSARQIAFRLHHGRDPQGQLSVGCDMAGCVAGAHLEDQQIRDARRRRIREANRRADSAFAAIFGGGA
jgi:hypothetical protein